MPTSDQETNLKLSSSAVTALLHPQLSAQLRSDNGHDINSAISFLEGVVQRARYNVFAKGCIEQPLVVIEGIPIFPSDLLPDAEDITVTIMNRIKLRGWQDDPREALVQRAPVGNIIQKLVDNLRRDMGIPPGGTLKDAEE